MAAAKFESIDNYLDAQPEATRRVLQRIRDTIRKVVPAAKETISYNIPTFTLNGKTVLHFAGWKTYCSVYPANSRVVAEFKDEIEPYLFEKSTLRFPLDGPLPLELIERIAKFRAQEA